MIVVQHMTTSPAVIRGGSAADQPDRADDRRTNATFASLNRLGIATRIAAWVIARLSTCARQPELQRYFDRDAYSQWQYTKAAPYAELIRPYVPTPCSKVLDLGCGQGGETAYYADNLANDEPSIIIGADLKRPRIVGNFPTRAQFTRCDITALPLRSGQVDLALTRDGFEHFMNPEAVLAEGNRVLRTGGRLIVCFAPYFGAKGPHLVNFVTVPYVHVFFSIHTLTRATQLVAARRARSLAPADRRAYGLLLQDTLDQALTGINHITIKRWERLLLHGHGWRLIAYRKFCGRRLHRPLLAIAPGQEFVATVFAVLEKAPGTAISPDDLKAAQNVPLPRVIHL